MITLDAETLSIIIILLVQTGGMVWWASSITTRIKHLEANSKNTEDVGARLASLEASVKALSITLDRVYQELQNKADKK